MIDYGQLHELDQILDLTKACGRHLNSLGIDQWDENYPDRKSLEADILKNQLFCHHNDAGIVNGIVVLNEDQDEEYKLIDWLTDELSRSLVVHRLAVHPSVQGQGIAKKLMDFAENYAVEHSYDSIRLDTFSKNERNQRFYLNRGYKNLGPVYLKYKKEHPYYCFELLLNKKHGK